MTEYHNPVLLSESIDGLNIRPAGIYVDVTFGGGGHSREILKNLGDNGRLIAFDQDEEALANAPEDPRFTLVNQNFRYLTNYLRFHKATPADGILADLGVSSHQFDDAARGFSTRFDSELDLRMSKTAHVSAKEIINEYPEERLLQILKLYGELENSYHIAMAIGRKRKEKAINTTFDLKEATARFAPRGKENKFYAQLFQALRIEVNEELDVLKDLLTQSMEVLKSGGRLVVISYNSLEDRLVKNFFKAGNFEGKIEKDFYGNIIAPMKSINRKVIVPTEEEITMNNRARSAKMRIAEKI